MGYGYCQSLRIKRLVAELGEGGMPPEGGPEGGQGGPPDSAGWMPSDLGPTPVTEEIALRDGRSVFQNSVTAKLAAGMICDWMGDDGWFQKVGWNIMEIPPGSDASINYRDLN